MREGMERNSRKGAEPEGADAVARISKNGSRNRKDVTIESGGIADRA
jgi:hypothetical protein